MKSKEISDAIDKLPICDDGKKGVKELVRTLGFEVEVKCEVKAGQLWQHKSTSKEILIINSGYVDCINDDYENKLIGIHLENDVLFDSDIVKNIDAYKFISENIEFEYETE